MEKLTKKRKIGVASILVVAIAIAALFYARQPEEVAFATEVKLRAYEALSDDTNIITAADLSDDQKVRDWTMQIIKETTANTKNGLSEADFDKIADRAVETLRVTIEAGNIEFIDGQLTDLSKAYISNAVANAISYEAPHADLKSTVDSGNTQYQQVIDMQKTLNALTSSNEALSESVNSLYAIYGLVDETASNIGNSSDVSSNNTSQGTSKTDSQDVPVMKPNQSVNATIGNNDLRALEQKVEAYYTQLLAEIHANSATGETPASNDSDTMVTINELTDTQSQMLTQISIAVTDIEGLTNNVTSINSSVDGINGTIITIQESVTKVQENIDAAQKDLQASVDTAKAELQKTSEDNRDALEKADADNKSELQKLIEKNTSELQANLDKDTKELNNKVDSNKEKTEKDLADNKKATEDADKKLQDQIDKNLTDVNKSMDNLQKLMEEGNNANKQALEKAKEDLQENLATLKETLSQDTSNLAKETQDRFNELKAVTIELETVLRGEDEQIRQALEITKEEINKQAEALDERLSVEIAQKEQERIAADKELNDKVDSNAEKTEKDLADNKKATEDADKRLQDQIDKNLSDVNKSMEDLQELMGEGDAANKQALDEAKKDLQEKLETLHSTLSQDVSNLAKDTQDKIEDIKATIDALEKALRGEDQQIRQALSTAKEELNKQAKELDEKLSAEIAQKEQERIAADKALQDQISTNTSAGLEKIADENIPGNTVFEKLGSLFNKDVELQTALDKEAEDRADAIREVNEAIHQLEQSMNTLIGTLEKEIRANSSAISKLQVQLSQFITASNSHSKIDVIGNITINKSGSANPVAGIYVWTVSGSNYVATISHEYLKGCVLVEVDYTQQYDFTPTYTVNSAAGTLTITIPTTQLSKYNTISLSDIVCYHTADDNSAVTVATTPTITMSSGGKTSGFIAGENVTVTIKAGAGEKIYYSTTGNMNWTEYTKPFTIAAPSTTGGTIVVTAYSTGGNKSDSSPALATCNFGKAASVASSLDEMSEDTTQPSESGDLPTLDSVENGSGVSIDRE